MPKPAAKRSANEKHFSRIELVSVRLLFLAALGIAGYLAWGSLQGGGVPGCGPEADCDKVLSSRWAYLFGVPVSLFAMPVYLLGLVYTLPKRIPWRSLLPIALVILVGALWFIGLQIFAIRAFCKFCMAAHVAGIIAAFIVVRRNPLPRANRILSAGTALVLAMILVAAQFASPAPGPKQVSLSKTIPPTNAVTTLRSNIAPTVTNTFDPMFSIIRGQFILDLRKVPLSGSLAAPKRMVKMFDYTCHHCRHLHHLLEPIARKHSNELAIVSLPMPLDASCNPVLRSTASAHMNACEYAKLALAVFFTEPAKFEEFSNWLYAPEHPPEVNAAKEFAASMLGRERLEAMLRDPRIKDQIRTHAYIYAASSSLGKSSALPQLIFPTGVSIGGISDTQQLEKILSDGLGLRPIGTN